MTRKILFVALILAALASVAWAGAKWSKAYPAGGSDSFKFNPGGGTAYIQIGEWLVDAPDANIDVSVHSYLSGRWRNGHLSIAAADTVIRVPAGSEQFLISVPGHVMCIHRSYGVTSVNVHGN